MPQLEQKGIDMRTTTFIAALLLLAGAGNLLSADRFTVEKTDDGAIVKLDGKLFTRYQKLFQNKPILHPVLDQLMVSSPLAVTPCSTWVLQIVNFVLAFL